jgi:hypothetical protein
MLSRKPGTAQGHFSLIAILAGLNFLQFGGIFWPSIGSLWMLINGSILAGIVICGVLARAIRSLKRRGHADR